MTVPPSISGCSGRSMPLARNPRCSSQTATTTAAATISMNAVFQNNSDRAIAASSTTADATAAGRSRPALPWSFVGRLCDGALVMGSDRSDLEQLGLLVLQHLVDRVGVLLGDA